MIEPLKPKRVSRTVAEIERRLAALQVALATDLDLLKREIIERLGAVENALEVMARELARKSNKEREDEGGSD